MKNFESKHFKLKELLSPDGLEVYKNENYINLNEQSVKTLDAWREFVDVKISVNFGDHRRRGSRSEKENKQVGGASKSKHLTGEAFDQTPHNYPLFDFYVQAIYWSKLRYDAGLQPFGALGIYPPSNFMHGDTRKSNGTIVLWNGYKKTLLTKVVLFDTIPLETLDKWVVKNLNLPKWELSRFTMEELLKRTL